ncbi:mesoderm-specific transcript -like protein [Brachionus plicatilis]|uniref:Mesoderm-specific transcript-like protein n=1 Tax=Brachionus plicatilis TaxID=10195 RepID=A0A3M7RRM5_BRAPC|nr:mesoderm-specific transcript -like protein [Brachionus plicatilis]
MKRFLSILTLLVAFIIGSYYYDQKSNEILEADFSQSLSNWFKLGNFFLYKNFHKIFYINEELVYEENLPSIVLLHGFPTSSYDYQKLWNLLRQDNRFKSIVTFDYLGYGFSDKPLDYEYSIFDMADMVDRLLLHLNITSVYLVAHDVGDTVVQELLRRENLNSQNHFKIKKLILMNGGLFTDIYKPIITQEILRTKYLNSIVSRYFFKYTIFKYSFSKVFGSLTRLSEQNLLDFYNCIRYNSGNLVLPLTIGYMNERLQYGEAWTDALNETVIPTLFIYGPADPINPRNKFPQKIRDLLPNVKLSILSELVGHYPQFEDTFTVWELIKKFIN